MTIKAMALQGVSWSLTCGVTESIEAIIFLRSMFPTGMLIAGEWPLLMYAEAKFALESS